MVFLRETCETMVYADQIVRQLVNEFFNQFTEVCAASPQPVLDELDGLTCQIFGVESSKHE